MKNIYFEHSNLERTLVNENVLDADVYSFIERDVARRSKGKFKIYYFRSWQNPINANETVVDVGSHSEYYILTNTK